MKICTNCGTQNDGIAVFCSCCGGAMATGQEEKKLSGNEKIIKSAEVSRERIIAVVLSYIAAYLFVRGTGEFRYSWGALAVFALVVIAVELVNRGRPRAPESFVWLGCFALCTVSFCFGITDVWESPFTSVFAVIFGVWWVLSRSGKLLEGKSGHLLPADAWTGFAVLPFKNYLLRFRTIVSGIRSLPKEKNEEHSGRIWWTVGACAACVLLLFRAASLLSAADSAFDSMLGNIWKRLHFNIDREVFGYLFASIPLGCLGCGLILAGASEDRSGIDMRRERLCRRLESARRVPEGLWIAVICLFSVLYAAFFALQGSYLFGAFVGNLPEGFIVSEYARQGFFELCRVMVVNSVLLWLATRMVTPEPKHEKGFKTVCLVLLAESVLFAVIAFSKLMLYISSFGFTPLRLQSTWLVCVLFAACVLWGYSIITDRPVFRKWMIFGAVSLSILAVV